MYLFYSTKLSSNLCYYYPRLLEVIRCWQLNWLEEHQVIRIALKSWTPLTALHTLPCAPLPVNPWIWLTHVIFQDSLNILNASVFERTFSSLLFFIQKIYVIEEGSFGLGRPTIPQASTQASDPSPPHLVIYTSSTSCLPVTVPRHIRLGVVFHTHSSSSKQSFWKVSVGWSIVEEYKQTWQNTTQKNED